VPQDTASLQNNRSQSEHNRGNDPIHFGQHVPGSVRDLQCEKTYRVEERQVSQGVDI
jgi:hypothetical protein